MSFQESARFCVAVLHLKAKEGFEDVRVRQGATLLHAIREFMGGQEVPLVVAGDFNDVPTSLVYKLFSEGKSVDSKSKEYTQDFMLRSAYTHYKENGVEPYTSF